MGGALLRGCFVFFAGEGFPYEKNHYICIRIDEARFGAGWKSPPAVTARDFPVRVSRSGRPAETESVKFRCRRLQSGCKKVPFSARCAAVCAAVRNGRNRVPETIVSGIFFMQRDSKMFTEEDVRWMRRAMELAQRGEGAVNPNPLVGAVIVRDGRPIAEGWHERWGGLHAERNALKRCTEPTAGATMYVTLEPCCHYGKTPPCTEAVIAAGIGRVVVGLKDPNPLVAGKGIARLEEAGIRVDCGLLEEELRWQNRIFLKYIATRRPWVLLKAAMTLDGKIAARTGDSRWVTGGEARHRVHEMRRRHMAILAGIGTVEADDPMLNCRLEGDPRQPVRIVADSSARIALGSQLVATARMFRTVVAHTDRADAAKLERLRAAGVETWRCAEKEGSLEIGDLLRQAGEAGLDSLLLEGGGTLNESFLRGGFVDEAAFFIAPKFIGGSDAKTPVEGRGIDRMADAVELERTVVERIGRDVLISGIIRK